MDKITCKIRIYYTIAIFIRSGTNSRQTLVQSCPDTPFAGVSVLQTEDLLHFFIQRLILPPLLACKPF